MFPLTHFPKAAAEEFAVAYENTYKMPIVVVHTMNVFGERQLPSKFIPKVVHSVIDGKEVTIHADSSKTKPGSRRYIHAKDVADGLLFILSLPRDYKHEGDFGGAKCPKFNLVGEQELDNLELAKMIASSVGQELKYKLVDFHSSRPGHDLRLGNFTMNITLPFLRFLIHALKNYCFTGMPFLETC